MESTSGCAATGQGVWPQASRSKCMFRKAKNAKQRKERNAKDCKGKKVKERKGKEGKESKIMQWKGMQWMEWKGERCKCIQCILRRTPTTPPPGPASCGRLAADSGRYLTFGKRQQRNGCRMRFGASSPHALAPDGFCGPYGALKEP